jgi:hypothetical protein
MSTEHIDWLQAEFDRRAAELRDQPPPPREITRRNAQTFAAQLDPLFGTTDTTTTED